MNSKAINMNIIGIPLPIYLVIATVIAITLALGWLPSGMLGALIVMMVFGGLFNVLGNNLPIIKTYLGGGAIVCIFAPAILVYAGLIPTDVISNIDSFMNTTGFLNFYIAALITGSILGMDRSLLLKAAIRFLPVALCAMTMAILAVPYDGWRNGSWCRSSFWHVCTSLRC
jgi:Na+/citrate or Na+/malate symporter